MKKVKGDVQVLKADVKGFKADVQVPRADVQTLGTRFDRLDAKVDLRAGRFEDVAGLVIADTQRITKLEGRVDILEHNAH